MNLTAFKPIDQLSKKLAQNAQSRWQTFAETAAAADVTIPTDTHVVDRWTYVFALSEFVFKSCMRNPAMLADLTASGELDKDYNDGVYAHKLSAYLAQVSDRVQLADALRQLRCREMVRIAYRDFLDIANIKTTMAELSAFAETCLESSLEKLYAWRAASDGTPFSPNNVQQYLVVMAMGKLGGRELNFSSDIDLIFTFPDSGETRDVSRPISNDEFFTRLSRDLIDVFTKASPQGIVFRIDTRLRPYGANGPLVMSFDNMESYYQRQGREWERYAWIKARVVAGDKEAGNQLLHRLNPFVYRRYFDFSAFESLRDMKKLISQEVRRKEMQANIKLGPGGIREIEFFGQMFQLIRGGVVPALQDGRILPVLELLGQQDFIESQVVTELSQAYLFLRKVEQCLQAFGDQQTHKLPTGEQAREQLRTAIACTDWATFRDQLRNYMATVHRHFNGLLERESGEADTSEGDLKDQLTTVWHDETGSDSPAQILTSAGFHDPQAVLRSLHYLKDNSETRALSKEGRERLDKLMPPVLAEVGRVDNSSVVLNRIVDLVKTIERRSCYISLLLEHPAAISHLVKLAEASPWIISYLAQHPVLLDELLDPRTLYKPPEKEDLTKELRQRLAKIDPEELEFQIETLCIFKQVNSLRVAAADVAGTLPLMRVSDYLTDIAELILEQVLELSWRHLVAKHGRPTCLINGQTCERGFAVAAYGKLGGIELGYASDLDLVFLHAGTPAQVLNGSQPIDTTQFFARLGQRVLHILTARTRAGSLYDADMRLRPSGSSGVLVSHIEGFGDYQRNEAWTWEHQALIRARIISGDRLISERFNQIRMKILRRQRSEDSLKHEVVEMRERMRREHLKPDPQWFDLKQSPGGIIDIEFLVQYLVLLKSHQHKELVRWTDNVRILQSLWETGVIDEATANILRKSYLIYRATAHRLGLQEKPAKVAHAGFFTLGQKVKEIWQFYLGKSTE